MLCHNADGSVTYIGGSTDSDKKNPELTGGSFFSTVDDDEDESENKKVSLTGKFVFEREITNLFVLII